MRRDVLTDGAIAATGIVWRFRGRTHVTLVAKASFEIAPDRTASHCGAGAFVPADPLVASSEADQQWARDAAIYRARCDVTVAGRARPAPGAAGPFLRLGFAESGRILVDKTLALGAPGGDGLDLAALGPRPLTPGARALLAEVGRQGPADGPAEGPLEVPEGFSWEELQLAPPDQQVPFPTGGAWLVLDGIDRRAPRVATQLPPKGAEARVRVVTGAAPLSEADVPLHCDAVAVDADRGEVTLVWRGTWALPEGVLLEDCRFVAGLGTWAQPVAWSDLFERQGALAQIRGAGAPVGDRTMVHQGTGAAAPAALPFAASPAPVSPAAASAVAPLASLARAAPVTDATRPGATAPIAPIAPFPLAAAATGPSEAVLSGLPWGGPLAAAPAPRVGDETLSVGARRPVATGSSTALAAKLKEMAETDRDGLRKLMASLRGD